MAEETSSCGRRLSTWDHVPSKEELSIEFQEDTARKSYLLNSKRIVASQLQALAKSLKLPTGVSPLETRQLIEGRLMELGYQPEKVQIVVTEEAGGDTSHILLVDESGVI